MPLWMELLFCSSFPVDRYLDALQILAFWERPVSPSDLGASGIFGFGLPACLIPLRCKDRFLGKLACAFSRAAGVHCGRPCCCRRYLPCPALLGPVFSLLTQPHFHSDILSAAGTEQMCLLPGLGMRHS